MSKKWKFDSKGKKHKEMNSPRESIRHFEQNEESLSVNSKSEVERKIYVRYYGMAYKKALGLSKNKQVAEDITQEIFLKIFSKVKINNLLNADSEIKKIIFRECSFLWKPYTKTIEPISITVIGKTRGTMGDRYTREPIDSNSPAPGSKEYYDALETNEILKRELKAVKLPKIHKSTEFSIDEFNAMYSNEWTCLDKLFSLKYGKMKKCPTCKSPANYFYVQGRKCFECNYCRQQLYPMVNTILQKSVTPLKTWFYIIYLMTATTFYLNISARRIKKMFGMTYKCAWRIVDSIKNLMEV